jgi:hypothetical protein
MSGSMSGALDLRGTQGVHNLLQINCSKVPASARAPGRTLPPSPPPPPIPSPPHDDAAAVERGECAPIRPRSRAACPLLGSARREARCGPPHLPRRHAFPRARSEPARAGAAQRGGGAGLGGCCEGTGDGGRGTGVCSISVQAGFVSDDSKFKTSLQRII